MKRAQDGDRHAYQAFLVDAAAIVRAFARRRVASAADVEDVVQETLLAIHRDRHTYDPARPIGPWLYGVTRHRCLDALRKHKRQNENEIAGAAGEHALARLGGPGESAAQGTVVGALRRALALLSETQRSVIRMLKLEGYSVAEIAERTGLSESAVKVTAHRGYKNLRRLMEEDEP